MADRLMLQWFKRCINLVEVRFGILLVVVFALFFAAMHLWPPH